MSTKRGIDISGYNTINNYSLLKNAVDFAILKVIRKDLQPDKLFAAHLNGCISNNIPVIGVYNYSYATTTEKAKIDACRVVEILRSYKLFTTVWLDVENKCQDGLGIQLINIILTYKEVIESAGLMFGVYTGMSFYNSNLKPYYNYISTIPMWIARYPSNNKMTINANPPASKKPNIPNMIAWQYTSKGQLSGVVGDLDFSDYYAVTASNKIVNDNAENVIDVTNYYLKLNNPNEISIVKGLIAVGEKDTSFANRSKIASANGIKLYLGTEKQNIQLLNLLKQGKLLKTTATVSKVPAIEFYPKYMGTTTSITTALSAVGEKDISLSHRKKIAKANNINSYTGTSAQNLQMVALLKKGQLIKA